MTWHATYAHRHARVEIERPMRPPSTAAVLAVLDDHIARVEREVLDPALTGIARSLTGIRLSSLRMTKQAITFGHPPSDELARAAAAREGRTR